jgi:dethiobiotin synthetase
VNYLVTGTDTGVGKTFVTVGLINAARLAGIDCIGMKPIAAGDNNEDTRAITAAQQGCEPEHLVNPFWYRTPVAPYTAGMIENRPVDLTAIRQAYEEIANRHRTVLVEGAGGFLVPILASYDFRDLAKELGLSVIVVAANRLGVINHTRLTVESIRNAGLECSVAILNHPPGPDDLSQLTNQSMLEHLLKIPVLRVEKDQSDFSELVKQLAL